LPVDDSEPEGGGGPAGEADPSRLEAGAENPELGKQVLAKVLGVVEAELELGTAGDCNNECLGIADVMELQGHPSPQSILETAVVGAALAETPYEWVTASPKTASRRSSARCSRVRFARRSSRSRGRMIEPSAPSSAKPSAHTWPHKFRDRVHLARKPRGLAELRRPRARGGRMIFSRDVLLRDVGPSSLAVISSAIRLGGLRWEGDAE